MKIRFAWMLLAAATVSDVATIFVWSGILGGLGGASAALRNFNQAKKVDWYDLAAHVINMVSVGTAYSMIVVSRYPDITVNEGWGVVGTAFILGIIGMPTIDLFFDFAKRVIAGIKGGNTTG